MFGVGENPEYKKVSRGHATTSAGQRRGLMYVLFMSQRKDAISSKRAKQKLKKEQNKKKRAEL